MHSSLFLLCFAAFTAVLIAFVQFMLGWFIQYGYDLSLPFYGPDHPQMQVMKKGLDAVALPWLAFRTVIQAGFLYFFLEAFVWYTS
jgi:hypothetical protein